jgi:hypothetical protein
MKERIHRYRLCAACLALLLLIVPPPARAGGSLAWEEVAKRIRVQDPLLAAFIAEHLDVARSGGAVRVGHDKDGNSLAPPFEVGERIPPYDFDAKPKGAPGDYSLTIHLEEISYDDGKTSQWQISITRKRKAK